MSMQVASHQTEGYTISTPMYEGPLDLLLALIERAELDITRFALAQVTDQYLQFMHQLQERQASEVSAFLVIAARLLQIKSAALLPRPSLDESAQVEEDPGEALARQLILYKQFKLLAHQLEQRQDLGLKTYLRINPIAPKIDAKLDLTGLSIHDIVASAREIFNQKLALPALSQVVSMPRVTIKDRIRSIIRALRINTEISFQYLLESRSRIEIVVSFLAMLELIKRHLVIVEQESMFEEIHIRRDGDLEGQDEAEIEFQD